MPAAAVERALAKHEAAPAVLGEAEDFGELTRDGGMISWGLPSRDDDPPEPDTAVVDRPPIGSLLYVDNRSRGAGVTDAAAVFPPSAAAGEPLAAATPVPAAASLAAAATAPSAAADSPAAALAVVRTWAARDRPSPP